jgi:hypothetical protein
VPLPLIFGFPAGAGNFSLHHRVQNGSGAHLASYPMGTRGSFPGVKRSGREADHSPLFSAEVKEWVQLYLRSPNSPSWRGAQLKQRDNFTFYPLIFVLDTKYRSKVWWPSVELYSNLVPRKQMCASPCCGCCVNMWPLTILTSALLERVKWEPMFVLSTLSPEDRWRPAEETWQLNVGSKPRLSRDTVPHIHVM